MDGYTMQVDTRRQGPARIGAEMWQAAGGLDTGAAVEAHGSIEGAARDCAAYHQDNGFRWTDWDGAVVSDIEWYVQEFLR
jgi:hypothetical protein